MDYKEIIIDLLGKVDNERFLRQLYTIIARHIQKRGI
jgi:hypothetical protein